MRRLGILARESPVWSIYHAYSGRSPNRKGKQDHEYTKSIERRRSSFPTPAADTPYPDEDLLSVQSYATPVCLTSQGRRGLRSEEHTSELQSHSDLVCRLLLEKKNKLITNLRTAHCENDSSTISSIA